MAKEKNNSYTANEIQVLKGLDAVRKRPGMYIGSTDSKGLHHLIWEIIDNSIDEVLSGYATNVKVIIHKGNSIEISDNGRGIPIEMHKEGAPTPQIVFGMLHAGGKFDDSSYKVAGGLHGVGASVVNALSEWLEITIYRDNKCYFQRFEDGGKVIKRPKIVNDSSKQKGTTVHFKPDSSVFSTTLIDYKQCAQRLKEAAFLIKGLKAEIFDERTNQSEIFKFNDGIVEYIKDLTSDKNTSHETIFLTGTQNGIYVEAAIQFCNNQYNETLLSFVNNIRTRDGGTHETGFKTGLTRAFNEYARLKKLLRDKEPNLEGVDIREGMTAILSVRIPEKLLQFESQTKSKLGTPDAKIVVEQIITEKLRLFLSEKGEIGTTLINKALKAFKVREAERKARDVERGIKNVSTKSVNMNGKLAPVQNRNPETNELFIVEGDSAGGSAKQGRDRRFQAILPLRGKVINAEKTRSEELLKNEEITSMIYTIGTGIGSDFNISKNNYKKIIIMTDADDDGAHIQILLLTFFFRYMRGLIENGNVYIALPPLYKLNSKNATEYAWNDDELKQKLNKLKNVNIQRFKGLGEMNSTQLWETTMNPESRTLIRVKIEDFSEADERISILMGDKVDPRREWIEQNVSFENEDNFTLEDIEVDSDE